MYLVPVPGTAQGIVVSDALYFQGERIEGLTLEFKGGKLVSMTAKSDIRALREAYEAGGAGKDALALIDIGINPGVRAPSDKPIHLWSKAGNVSISLGDNGWAGGDISSGFGIATYLVNGTVSVDGTPLVQDGKLAALDKVASR